MTNTARRAAMAGRAAVTSLVIVLIAMHLLQPGLNPVDHLVSEYAYGRLGWLVQMGYALAGLGTAAMALPAAVQLGSSGWATAFRGSLLVIGIGLIGTGLTRIDTAGLAPGSVPTTSGRLHEMAGYIAILGLVAGAFALPSAIRRNPEMSAGTVTLRRYRWAILASLTAVPVARGLGTTGLGQRLFLAVTLSWLIYIGTELSRSDAALTPAASH